MLLRHEIQTTNQLSKKQSQEISPGKPFFIFRALNFLSRHFLVTASIMRLSSKTDHTEHQFAQEKTIRTYVYYIAERTKLD